MKVMLTGATGFLGSHILHKLIENNIDTIVLKRSFSNDKRICMYNTLYKSYDIDTINLEKVFEEETHIDAIIHCATDYGRKDDKISEVMQSNVVFPVQLLELSSAFKVDKFYNTDTFFNIAKNSTGYMQNYTLTKKQFLDWGKLFAESGKIDFINMRLEHLYGEGDNDGKFIPFIIDSCLKNIEKIDLTDGEHLRDFIYIDDVVSAYLAVLLKSQELKGFQEFEVGCGKAIKVKDFVIAVKEIANSQTKLNFGALPYRKNEILYSEANIDNLKSLGWIPKFSHEHGIQAYIKKLKG